MKKINFDGLDHIKAPREWLDKAALIPEEYAKKKRFTAVYRSAAAAALVLASVSGLLVFVFFGINGGAPLTARRSESTSVSESDIGSGTEYRSSNGNNGETLFQTFPSDALNPSQSASSAAESGSQSDSETDTAGNNAGTEPTEKPSEKASEGAAHPGTSKPTLPTETQKPTSQSPTQKPTSQSPTQKPTSQSPTQRPTTPTPTSPPERPTETQEPTIFVSGPDNTVSVIAVFPASLITDGEPIYCIVQQRGYASAEVKDRFADYRRAHYMVMHNGNVFAGYDAEVDQPISDGTVTYDYFFYNSKGEILASGSQTV